MVKVKICGITNLEDAIFACEYGTDALGFVFYKKSPRYIIPEQAGEIIKNLPPFVTTVGVFVNESHAEIDRYINLTGITTVQLHGDEPQDFIDKIGLPVIKAIRIRDEKDIKIMAKYSVSAFLLDSFTDSYGGSGRTFNWNIAKKAKKYRRIIVSGGLTPENVVSAIEIVRPYGVDVSSGVESRPGKKDNRKVLAFIKAVRSANY